MIDEKVIKNTSRTGLHGRRVRGYDIAVLDVGKCTSTETCQFGTFGSRKRALKMNLYLKSLPHGSVIAGVTEDEPSR